MQSEGNTPKTGEPTVGLSFITMLQHTGQFWLKISFSKKQYDKTGTSPNQVWSVASQFVPVPSTEISI
jgi:hypothetical protein